MSSPSSTPRLLVLGASGRLGRAVLRHLLTSLHVEPQRIVAATREPGNLKDVADQGVEVRGYDLLDPSTFTSTINGVSRVLLISTNFDNQENFKTFLDLMATHGVKHVLYTSFYGVDTSTATFAPIFRAAEQAIRESKLPAYTLLRNGYYWEVCLSAYRAALQTGKWYSAAKEGRVTYISIDALALANATALVGDKPVGKVVSLTGPEALTVDEIVPRFNKSLGKSFEVVHASQQELAAFLEAHSGLSPPIAAIVTSIDTSVITGDVATVNSDYETLVGAKPTTQFDWLQENKEMLLEM